MEDSDLKIYLKMFLKNWKWIVFVVGLTLVFSIVFKFVMSKPPFPEYSTEVSVNTSAVVFSNKKHPVAGIDKNREKALLEEVSQQLKLNPEDFDIKFDLTVPNIVKISGVSKDGSNLGSYVNKIAGNLILEIKTKNHVDTDEPIKQLNYYYKNLIIDSSGKILVDKLQKFILDEKGSNDAKPDEIIAGEKIVSDLSSKVEKTQEMLTKSEADGNELLNKLNMIKQSLMDNDKSADETQVLLKNLKARPKSDDKADNEYIKQQIIYLEQSMDLISYKKSYYADIKTQTEYNINKLKDMESKIQSQLKLDADQLQMHKIPLDVKLNNHRKQIELYKKIYNAVYDNSVLESKLTVNTTIVKRVAKIDARLRETIISVWLAFILVCCGVIVKEYYFTGSMSRKEGQSLQ